MNNNFQIQDIQKNQDNLDTLNNQNTQINKDKLNKDKLNKDKDNIDDDNVKKSFSITLYIIFIVYFIIGSLAFYYSYSNINKDQNIVSKILISIGAFFMNISYFIKILFLNIIGYKWFNKKNCYNLNKIK